MQMLQLFLYEAMRIVNSRSPFIKYGKVISPFDLVLGYCPVVLPNPFPSRVWDLKFKEINLLNSLRKQLAGFLVD